VVLNRLYAAFAIIAVLSGIVGAGYLYFNFSQKKLAQITMEAQTLRLATEEQNAVIQQLQKDQVLIAELLRQANEANEISRKKVSDLEEKFTKKTWYGERDIGFVAENKPELVKKAINKATIDALRCMEQATGKEYENLDCN
jgi:predicted XRE-type DNA-binding protein